MPTTLAHEGFNALKADVLARKLGVSRVASIGTSPTWALSKPA
jgi:hypothetical protein